jgi:flavin reductase (DIM6/NTAB) family NADH-FMN oxidoreductase RutF
MPILRPLDLICLASAKKRDTLENIRDTGEFVVNMATEKMADMVIPLAKNLPAEVDEFEYVGIGEKPSEIIKAPGMAGCYAWMECNLYSLIEEDKFVLIIGRVARLEILDEALADDGTLDLGKAGPLMMTSLKKGMKFCSLHDIDQFQPFGAMFEDGKDPFGAKYES